MNGFMLVGSRIRVTMAMVKPRQSYWRKVRPENSGDKFKEFKQNDVRDSDGSNRDENLWGRERYPKNQSKKKEVDVKSVMLGLHEWGLGEIKVQRMGGKSYLLSFEDEELFTKLEDVNWSYVKEIFAKIEAGNMVHVVRVSEIDFKDESAISKISKNCDVDAEQNKSESNSESVRSKTQVPRIVGLQEVEDEALNAVCFGKENNYGKSLESELLGVAC
ncbi:hypothetical protein V6N13_055686 [Hibiscus sabdariffa]